MQLFLAFNSLPVWFLLIWILLESKNMLVQTIRQVKDFNLQI